MADDAAAPEGELIEAPETPEPSPSASAETTESPDLSESDNQHPDQRVSLVKAADPDTASGESEDFEESGTEEDEGSGSGDSGEDDAEAAALETVPAARPKRAARITAALALGLIVVLALCGLVGWLGWRAYQNHAAEQQRALFIQVGKQAAINLTTISYDHAEDDVKRILDSATDQFYDDFSKRSQPFVEVVKQAQAKSTGEVTSAGLESEDPDGAQVLVAVTVKATNAGVPEQAPRYWRMRVSVKKVDDDVKVSNVGFVP